MEEYQARKQYSPIETRIGYKNFKPIDCMFFYLTPFNTRLPNCITFLLLEAYWPAIGSIGKYFHDIHRNIKHHQHNVTFSFNYIKYTNTLLKNKDRVFCYPSKCRVILGHFECFFFLSNYVMRRCSSRSAGSLQLFQITEISAAFWQPVENF